MVRSCIASAAAGLVAISLATPASAQETQDAKTGVVRIARETTVAVVDGSEKIAPDGRLVLPCGNHHIAWRTIEIEIPVPCGGEVDFATEPTVEMSTPAVPTSEPPTRWRANEPLLIAGAIGFSGAYGAAVVPGLPGTGLIALRVALVFLTIGLACLGGCSPVHGGGIQLLVPVAGPILFAKNHPRDDVLNPSGRRLAPGTESLLYVDAGVQAAGLALIVASVALGKTEPARRSDDAPQKNARVSIAPHSIEGGAGLSLVVTNW